MILIWLITDLYDKLQQKIVKKFWSNEFDSLTMPVIYIFNLGHLILPRNIILVLFCSAAEIRTHRVYTPL